MKKPGVPPAVPLPLGGATIGANNTGDFRTSNGDHERTTPNVEMPPINSTTPQGSLTR